MKTKPAYNLWRLLQKELALVPLPQSSKLSQQQQLISPSASLEQIVNMVSLPFYLEKFTTFGLLTCLNSFLRLVVLLPLKILADLVLLLVAVRGLFTLMPQSRKTSTMLRPGNLVFASLVLLAIHFGSIDTSKIYHTVRAQSSIKLYVMFGVLEITDKLLSTVGQDLLNYLFSTSPLELINTRDVAIYMSFYVASAAYLTCHTVVLVCQTIALNVAANSYTNSLVTLLLSNQFAEIKGSVFKRLDKEGLFQMSCADVVERFQLLIQLGIIALRNMVQIGTDPQHSGLLPNATIHGVNKWFGVVLGPTVVVIGSELVVDWVKHSYVTKFNKIRPKVYTKYLDVLSQDVVDNFRASVVHESSDRVQQRLGIPLPALFTLFAVMCRDPFMWLFVHEGKVLYPNVAVGVVVFGVLLVLKLLLELGLLKWSTSILRSSREKEKGKETAHEHEHEQDYVPGVVSGGQGATDNETRSKLLSSGSSSSVASFEAARAAKDARADLSSVTRYRMVSKRIF